MRLVIGDAFHKGAHKAHDGLWLFADESIRRRDVIVRIRQSQNRGVGELAKSLLARKQRVRRVDEGAVHGTAQQGAEPLALVADLHQGGFLHRLDAKPGQYVARGEIRGAAKARDGDFASLELFAVLDPVVDVKAEGHGGGVSGDENVSRPFKARSLRGGPASAADYLHVSREQHLKRLASTLEKDEINIQTIALERAGFFGDIQHVDAAADTSQSQKEMLRALSREGRGAKEKEQKKNDRSLHRLSSYGSFSSR